MRVAIADFCTGSDFDLPRVARVLKGYLGVRGGALLVTVYLDSDILAVDSHRVTLRVVRRARDPEILHYARRFCCQGSPNLRTF